MDFIIIILAVLLAFAKLILVSLLIVAIWLYLKTELGNPFEKLDKKIRRGRE